MDAPSHLEILQSTSLPTLVQKEVVRLILEGEIQAGDRLTEGGLATKLGVSRGPVREAFRGLEEAGLVKALKNRGVFVRRISISEASELYEVRSGLDETAARILAPKITEDQLAVLQNLVDEMGELSKTDQKQEYYLKNIQFHDLIIEMTENKKLQSIYRKLMNEMHLMRRRTLVHGSGMPRSISEHKAIMDALTSRDPNIAGPVLREHVLQGRNRLLAILEAEGERDTSQPS